eukprot:CAMPEP_0114638622 /NCGR_PEP_ID=MMETSP0191-20121206/720_1 /TAXON_ID=126664 /ORGANISM="Sorites sp." /LENGTH=260 /DNA_ID=CAMNT_0001850405 /DNA_START=63 /DNA_END=845 /DNA_ORIENTATION=-
MSVTLAPTIENHVEDVLKPLDNLQECDTVAGISLGILVFLSLVVCFFGYRIYKFAFVVFAFLLGFGIEAAVGSAWLANNPEPNGVTEKVIILVCCVLWGTLFLVLAQRYRETIEKLIGFFFGACVGLVFTGAVLYVLQKPLDNALGSKYQGWENFAGVTLGVPIALLTGYFFRNKVMILVMAVTALVGAAAAWRWGRALIGCAQAEPGVLDNHFVNLVIFIGIASLGLTVQFCFRPHSAPAKTAAPSSVEEEAGAERVEP